MSIRVILLLCVMLFSLYAETKKAPTKKFALVISGGISMGAYQAGYNWALMKYYLSKRKDDKEIDFVSFAGTSAGSINALQSALTWCHKGPDNGNNSLSNNPFYDTWTAITLNDLLPYDESAYRKKEGYFTRKAFDDTVESIEKSLHLNIYEANCSAPLGFSVTFSDPTPSIDPATNLAFQDARRFVPLYLKTDARGRPYFTPNFDVNFTATALYLGKRQECVAFDSTYTDATVKQSVLASSAFPVAFSPVEIDYCYGATKEVQQACTRFRDGDLFVDGGVFDRIPLTLGREQYGNAYNTTKVDYFFMNPDARRHFCGESKPMILSKLYASRQWSNKNLISFVGGSVQTARSEALKHELDTYFPPGDIHRKLRLSSRAYPIVGITLNAFGAFFSRTFEKYDYFVGVYDAMYDIAKHNYQENNATSLKKSMQKVYKVLMNDINRTSISDENGLYVINLLADKELAYRNDAPLMKDGFECGEANRTKSSEPSCDDYLLLHNALEKTDATFAHKEEDEESSAYFKALLKNIKAESPTGLALVPPNVKKKKDLWREYELYDYAMANPNDFMRVPTYRALKRAVTLQTAEDDNAALALALGGYMGGELYKLKYSPYLCIGDDWPCTLPNDSLTFRYSPTSDTEYGFWRKVFIPYEVGLDVINSGAEFTYNPTLFINHYDPESKNDYKSFYLDSVDLKFGFYIPINSGGEDASFFHISPTLSFNLFAKDIAKLGLGGGVAFDLTDKLGDDPHKWDTWQANASLQFLSFFRVTYMHRFEYNGTNNLFWLGVSDIPSLLYWLSK